MLHIFGILKQFLYFLASLPVPGGYNPYGKSSNHESKTSSNNSEASQKLKKTVQTLEASLAKKNKEIAELKKAKHDSEDNNMESLAEVVARVQALRVNHNPKDDQRVRDKVCTTSVSERATSKFYVKTIYVNNDFVYFITGS